MTAVDFRELAARVEDLPSLPQVVLEVRRVVHDPRTTVDELVGVLERDQGLVARILKLANSAYYGYSGSIATLKRAVIVLGFNVIEELVLAATTYPLMARRMEGYSLDRGELWRHSVVSGICARRICENLNIELSERAFTAALIHDLGKVVLDYYVHDRFRRILEVVEGEGKPFFEAEREVMGCDHAQLGGWVGKNWNLPPVLVNAIRHHHQPRLGAGGDDHDPELEAVVHISNAVCNMLGFGIGTDGLYNTINEEALEVVGMGEREFGELMAGLEGLDDVSEGLLR